MYDFLIVGAGLWGSVFAHEATKKGKKCLVIDKRKHIGGNVFTQNVDGINVHKYGAHIFHTNDKLIWDYINQFAEFNHYTHTVVANYKGKIFNLPFNMNTFNQMWHVITPQQAQQKIEEQIKQANISNPKNLYEQAISLVGIDIFNTLIKDYTEKQWGLKCEDLPNFIIKRLPVRFNYDNNYFNDKYQGIPIGGYTSIISKMLDGIEVKLETNYFENRTYFESIAQTIVFTGKIDEFFNYQFGELAYRSLRFEEQRLEIENYQGCSVMNYTDLETPFTRIIEHKHFEFGKQNHTVITKEFSLKYEKGYEPYYPINDEENMRIYRSYKTLSEQQTNVIFGGRLAEYRYYDMHQIIGSALTCVNRLF